MRCECGFQNMTPKDPKEEPRERCEACNRRIAMNYPFHSPDKPRPKPKPKPKSEDKTKGQPKRKPDGKGGASMSTSKAK